MKDQGVIGNTVSAYLYSFKSQGWYSQGWLKFYGSSMTSDFFQTKISLALT